jgi:hypothetical protein
MKVYGYEVSQGLIAACIRAMRGRQFSALDIAHEAQDMGAPWKNDISLRIADRLIQRERKAGHIVRSGRGWTRA